MKAKRSNFCRELSRALINRAVFYFYARFARLLAVPRARCANNSGELYCENIRMLIAVSDLPYAIEFSFHPVAPRVI